MCLAALEAAWNNILGFTHISFHRDPEEIAAASRISPENVTGDFRRGARGGAMPEGKGLNLAEPSSGFLDNLARIRGKAITNCG